jgi:hypothetical protein
MKSEVTIDKTRQSAIIEILNQNDAKVGVEIGVFKGGFSREILDGWGGKLYMVDPWRPLGDEYIDSSNHKFHTTAYSDAMESIRGYEDRAIMIRALSDQAVELFADESLDYVYIDGNHSYEYVKKDIEMWWPKLKKGGLMSGHDYVLIDWDKYEKTENGKDMHVYANEFRYFITSEMYDDIDITYAGAFGVNPAVHEFAQQHNLEYDLTREWNATFLIIK